MNLKTKLKCFAAALMLPVMFLPTGCMCSFSASEASSRRLYQPPTLALRAGVAVQTVDGIHVPQVNEVWHSPARFEALEQEALNLSAALAEERAKK